jgi:hypothetical protein
MNRGLRQHHHPQADAGEEKYEVTRGVHRWPLHSLSAGKWIVDALRMQNSSTYH